jgi:D-alanyl-D-alanine dipeptidase
MKREDGLYAWLVLVRHNERNLPGAGSCIFVHVMRHAGKGTAGCTGVRTVGIVSMLGWLRTEAHPLLVQLPEAEYDARRQEWGLP